MACGVLVLSHNTPQMFFKVKCIAQGLKESQNVSNVPLSQSIWFHLALFAHCPCSLRMCSSNGMCGLPRGLWLFAGRSTGKEKNTHNRNAVILRF
jgi:hypothetical protein